MTRLPIMRRTRLGLLALACLALASAGCVERKITIVSDPPGALAYVNDVEVGRTPVTIPFLWYGDYDVRLRAQQETKAGKQDYYLHTHKSTPVPVYQWLGIDLLAELSPMKFVDHKVWAFDIPAVQTPTQEELLERASQMRQALDEPAALKRPRPKIAPVGAPATQPAAAGK